MYSGILKSQKKKRYNQQQNKILANPRQPVLPNNWKTLPGRRLRLSTYRGRLTRPRWRSQEDPKVPTVAFLGAYLYPENESQNKSAGTE